MSLYFSEERKKKTTKKQEQQTPAIFSLSHLKGILTDQMLDRVVKMSNWKQILLFPCQATVLTINQTQLKESWGKAGMQIGDWL